MHNSCSFDVTLLKQLQLHCQTASTVHQVQARSEGQVRQLAADSTGAAAPWAMEASLSRLCRSIPSLLLRSLSFETSASSSLCA